MSPVRALVLTGFGLNCDGETAYALELAGAQADRIHLNSLVDKKKRLQDYQIFVIGGGFSWADEHGGGVILAMRLRNRLEEELLHFVDQGGLVLGICNGFQVLVNLGLLPNLKPGAFKRQVALVANECGNFRDQWVHLTVNSASPCIFTKGIRTIELPIRHGEGKFYAEPEIYDELGKNQQLVLYYALPDGHPAKGRFPCNPNGSLGDVAGICDPAGRIFGLMPHPEAFNCFANHPEWTYFRERNRKENVIPNAEGEGIQIFRNAVRYFD